MLGKLLGNIMSGGLLSAGKKVAELISSYKEKKISKEILLAELVNEIPRLQMEINQAEANHPSIFVSVAALHRCRCKRKSDRR